MTHALGRRDFLEALPGLAAARAVPSGWPAGPPQDPTVCNVLSFGAAGDGRTDDTDAITAAVAACPASGQLLFPPGRRFVMRRVRIDQNLMVEAQGATVLLQGADAGFAVEGTVDWLRAYGGTFVGGGDPDERQIPWTLGNVPEARITNVLIDGLTTHRCAVGVKVAGTRDVPVTNVTVRASRFIESVGLDSGRGYGLQFTHGNYGKAIGCHFERCQRHGLYFAEGKHYVAVANIFQEHRDGVADGSARVALVVSRSDNVSVVGNVFQGCRDGGLGVETDPDGRTCRNVTVSGNTFQDGAPFDILVGNDDPATHGSPQNVTIVANAFLRDPEAPAGTAIDVRTVHYLTIANNTFWHEATGSGAPTAIYLRGIGGDRFTQFVNICGNTFRGDAPSGQAASVEIGESIARGESSVLITSNLDHTPRGVRSNSRLTNGNIRIGSPPP